MSMIDLNAKKITGPVIRLHPNDNVVVARTDVAIGMEIPSEGISSRSQVPSGHKIAARNIQVGEAILKYNVCIGFACFQYFGRHICPFAQCNVQRI
jgi:altronate hydrolase